jgi:hypothetical protein
MENVNVENDIQLAENKQLVLVALKKITLSNPLKKG